MIEPSLSYFALNLLTQRTAVRTYDVICTHYAFSINYRVMVLNCDNSVEQALGFAIPKSSKLMLEVDPNVWSMLIPHI